MPQLDLTTFTFLYFLTLGLFWFQFIVSYLAVSYSFQYWFSSYYFSFAVVLSPLLKLKSITNFKKLVKLGGRVRQKKIKINKFTIELAKFYKK